MPLNTTSELLSDLKKGKMVVLMDDEDRENEGDLILPAENVSPAVSYTHLRAHETV
mgnify:CR=1 FL=1